MKISSNIQSVPQSCFMFYGNVEQSVCHFLNNKSNDLIILSFSRTPKKQLAGSYDRCCIQSMQGMHAKKHEI